MPACSYLKPDLAKVAGGLGTAAPHCRATGRPRAERAEPCMAQAYMKTSLPACLTRTWGRGPLHLHLLAVSVTAAWLPSPPVFFMARRRRQPCSVQAGAPAAHAA